MINSALLEAYQTTLYEVFEPKITITIANENQELQKFLKENNYSQWCFITAWNPYSMLLSQEENTNLNRLLELDLKDFPIYAGQGKDAKGEWPPEDSYFVANISEQQAIALGTKYNQNAIVFGTLNEKAKLLLLQPVL
jgi:hypothetical protein